MVSLHVVVDPPDHMNMLLCSCVTVYHRKSHKSLCIVTIFVPVTLHIKQMKNIHPCFQVNILLGYIWVKPSLYTLLACLLCCY